MDQPAYLMRRGDALAAYGTWPAPTAVISDGAYGVRGVRGVRGFRGDTTGAGRLIDWYRPHELMGTPT